MEITMIEKKKSIKMMKKSGAGIEVLDDGIKTTGRIRGGVRCACSPGMWQDGHDYGGCGCACIKALNVTNGTANYDIAH